MKRFSRILAVMAALLMVVACFSSVFADMSDKEDYSYTIKVYSGKEGKFVNPSIGTVSGDGKTITITAKAGTELTISPATTGLTMNKDSEYYVRGFRIAGHDAGLSSKEVNNQNFVVDEDRSYQAAYGLKGGMVKYTIRYLDKSGDGLADNDEYYGMAGDKPVVAYKYIEGYQPNAYNLTKTLQQNESDNLFTFTYSKIATASSDDADDEDGNDGSTDGTNANGNRSRTNADNASGINGDTAGDADATAEGNEPAEVIDLDDGDTPLSDTPGGGSDAVEIDGNDTPKSGVNGGLIAGGAAAVAAAAAAAAVVVARRRRENDE